MAAEPRRAAQARADQIRAFRRELDELRAAEIVRLSSEQEAGVADYHERTLAALARDFDVDQSERDGQLSRGLRLASLFGAAALIATVTALVERVWGQLGLPAQVTLLTAFPLASLAGVHIAAERERTRYVAGLFALVACGTAWFAIGMSARLLDLPLSELLLWPAAAFGFAVAASYGFRLVFVLSLAISGVAVASVFFAAGRVPWTVVFARLEPLLGAAMVLLVASRYMEPAGEGFGRAARHAALALALGASLLLANVRGFSLLAFLPGTTLAIYQVLFVPVALFLLWRALRSDDGVGAALVTGALALFLFVRYVDWFWDLMPAWAFFLVMSATAFAVIAALRKARRRVRTA
jgi:hypothetical protein